MTDARIRELETEAEWLDVPGGEPASNRTGRRGVPRLPSRDDRRRVPSVRGHGRELLSFVAAWAKENDCELVALSSGVQREDAHRFYEGRVGMERASYVHKRPMD